MDATLALKIPLKHTEILGFLKELIFIVKTVMGIASVRHVLISKVVASVSLDIRKIQLSQMVIHNITSVKHVNIVLKPT